MKPSKGELIAETLVSTNELPNRDMEVAVGISDKRFLTPRQAEGRESSVIAGYYVRDIRAIIAAAIDKAIADEQVRCTQVSEAFTYHDHHELPPNSRSTLSRNGTAIAITNNLRAGAPV